jgi:hypothetical protein
MAAEIENVTDETADVDELVYQVEVLVEVRLPAPGPDDDEDAGFEEAHAIVDNTLQRAWDTDQGRGFGHRIHPWHFEMFEDSVKVVDKDPAVRS